jgi:hypothetical protein
MANYKLKYKGTKIDELLDKINNLTIDTTFQPASSNPQSGEAVAEAISDGLASYTPTGVQVGDDYLASGFEFRITYSDSTTKTIKVLGAEVTPNA